LVFVEPDATLKARIFKEFGMSKGNQPGAIVFGGRNV
jgi:hypothetical protein